MAKAPKPGARRQQEEATKSVRLTINGETREFQPGSVPLGIRTRFRKAHGGIPFEQYLPEEAIGLDSIAALWWLAGLISSGGTTTETAVEALEKVESVEDIESGIEFVLVDPDDEDLDDPS